LIGIAGAVAMESSGSSWRGIAPNLTEIILPSAKNLSPKSPVFTSYFWLKLGRRAC
jgi:hypothetical protein